MEPADNRLPEKEALELIARVFDSQTRRMNRVRGGHFALWGTVLSLTALLEYGLWRLTGTPQILWSAFLPLLTSPLSLMSSWIREAEWTTSKAEPTETARAGSVPPQARYESMQMMGRTLLPPDSST